MRFGISPLSLELIIDKVLKEKGLAGLTQFKLSKLVESVAKMGYQHCEIIFDIFQLFPIQRNKRSYYKIKPLKDTVHISSQPQSWLSHFQPCTN